MSTADAAAVNSNGVETLLTNGLKIFFIKGKPIHSNGVRCLPKNSCECTILGSWVFDNFIFIDKLFAKALKSLKAYLSVNNNLRGKLVSSLESPNTFEERFKVTSVPFFIPDFNLLSCKLDNFAFEVLLYYVIDITL